MIEAVAAEEWMKAGTLHRMCYLDAERLRLVKERQVALDSTAFPDRHGIALLVCQGCEVPHDEPQFLNEAIASSEISQVRPMDSAL